MKLPPIMLKSSTALATALLVACGAPEDAPPGGEGTAETAAGEAAAEPMAEVQEAQLPDTTLEAVWAYLQAQDYRSSWNLWPGKAELYSGGEPHGMLLTTYVNGPAGEALRTGAGTMPVGAIIVKENFRPDSVHVATTVMYKTESFNPDHNNWWFLKRNADGSVDAAGRGAGCESCHSAGLGAENDYILTDDFSQPVTGG